MSSNLFSVFVATDADGTGCNQVQFRRLQESYLHEGQKVQGLTHENVQHDIY